MKRVLLGAVVAITSTLAHAQDKPADKKPAATQESKPQILKFTFTAPDGKAS